VLHVHPEGARAAPPGIRPQRGVSAQRRFARRIPCWRPFAARSRQRGARGLVLPGGWAAVGLRVYRDACCSRASIRRS
jgi:hypothetical protein